MDLRVGEDLDMSLELCGGGVENDDSDMHVDIYVDI
jgi:hypothetical protein